MLVGMGSLGTGTVVQNLVDAIDLLVEADVNSLADAESIKLLERELSRFEAIVTKAVAAFDVVRGDWANDGAKGAAPWVATACRLPRAAACRQAPQGEDDASSPGSDRSLGTRPSSSAHLDLVASVRREGTKEALSRDEPLLVSQAKSLRFEQFARAVAYWDQMADPDGTEEAAEAQRARRDVYIEASLNGMFLGKMTLDPVAGAIVAGELGRIEQEFFEADWARAKAKCGENASIAHLWRTPAQRRADALVEMASRSALVPPEGRRPAPLFSVLVDWPTLRGRICELAEGIVVTPGSLVPWLGLADFERAVMDSKGRVEVSATSRLFTGATRRAVELREPAMRPSVLLTSRDIVAKSTMSCPGPPAGTPLRTTVACSVPSTTACATESGHRPPFRERRRDPTPGPLHQLRFRVWFSEPEDEAAVVCQVVRAPPVRASWTAGYVSAGWLWARRVEGHQPPTSEDEGELSRL